MLQFTSGQEENSFVKSYSSAEESKPIEPTKIKLKNPKDSSKSSMISTIRQRQRESKLKEFPDEKEIVEDIKEQVTLDDIWEEGEKLFDSEKEAFRNSCSVLNREFPFMNYERYIKALQEPENLHKNDSKNEI